MTKITIKSIDDGAQFMRRTEIEKVLRIGRSTIYNLMSQGRFPKPVRVSPRAVAWRVLDIEQYLENLQKEFQPTKETENEND